MGEHKYKAKPYPESVEQRKIQQAESDNKIAELKAQVQALILIVAGKDTLPKVEEPVVKAEPEVKEVKEEDKEPSVTESKVEAEPEFKEPTMSELRAEAKELGINTFRMKKAHIAVAIANKKKK